MGVQLFGKVKRPPSKDGSKEAKRRKYAEKRKRYKAEDAFRDDGRS